MMRLIHDDASKSFWPKLAQSRVPHHALIRRNGDVRVARRVVSRALFELDREVRMKTAKRRRGLQGELDIANEDERLGAVITGCELGVTSEQQWNQVRAVDACDRRLSAQITFSTGLAHAHNMTVLPLPVGLDTPIRRTPRSSADKHARRTSSWYGRRVASVTGGSVASNSSARDEPGDDLRVATFLTATSEVSRCTSSSFTAAG